MYLHVGNGKTVKRKDVIGIFDLDSATVSKVTKDFVNRKEKEGNLEYDYSDLPRSFVLVDGAPCKIVLSRISPQGLRLRVEEGYVSSEVGEE
jgi:regulator of extracellular matrix RemA (YlzA/DUF370 family)